MKRLTTFGLIALSLIVGMTVSAQQATEVYIPIGKSPGISANKSVIGSISAVEYQRYRMTISADDKKTIVTMTPNTRYYVDKNSVKQRNVTGSIDDCEVGRRVEAYIHEDGNAVWVKIASR